MIGHAAAVSTHCVAKTVRGALSRQTNGMSPASPYSHTRINHGLVPDCASSSHAEKVKQLNKKSAGSNRTSHFAGDAR